MIKELLDFLKEHVNHDCDAIKVDIEYVPIIIEALEKQMVGNAGLDATKLESAIVHLEFLDAIERHHRDDMRFAVKALKKLKEIEDISLGDSDG